MYLSDYLNVDDLNELVANNFVSVRNHPEFPLRIYNYTAKASGVRQDNWPDAMLKARGLIVDDYDQIRAVGLKKFWNFADSDYKDMSFICYDKLDGCFLSNTKLNLWGGGTITIGEVVRNKLTPTLIGMDKSGELVPTKVTDWHNNGTKNNWMTLETSAKISEMAGSGSHPNRLKITTNHHILINGEYRPAGEAKPGDVVYSRLSVVNDAAKKMIQDSLLGDGCIVRSHNSFKYQESHSKKHISYVDYLRWVLGSAGVHRSDTISGYGSDMCWVGSFADRTLGELQNQWYSSGKKAVPEDLNWMDDLTVAKWYMDDGSLAHSELQRDRALFATNGFSEQDVLRLGNKLSEMYDVSCSVYFSKGWCLRVNAGRKGSFTLDNMWSAIAPHIHPSMRYKLPVAFRDVDFIGYEQGGREYSLIEETVVSTSALENTKQNFPSGRVGFDISTETENYMVNGLLVHNSLGIVYQWEGTPYISTRGSFDSHMARWANSFLDAHPEYRKFFAKFDALQTPHVEIIYRDNRIVVEYDFEDLVLLGVNQETHNNNVFWQPADQGWEYPGRTAETFHFKTFSEMAKSVRPNAEGYIIQFEDKSMYKFKYERYLELHRVVSNMNERTIYNKLVEGGVNDFILALPNELQPEANQIKTDLLEKHLDKREEIRKYFLHLLEVIPPHDHGRKTFALKMQEEKAPAWIRAGVFASLDNNFADLHKIAWKQVRP